jgi:hypothetical protein
MSQTPNYAEWAKFMPTDILKRDLEIRIQNTKPGDKSDGFIEAVQAELEKRQYEELKKNRKTKKK